MPSSSDDDSVAALSEQELYHLVHRATRDAVLDAVGTVLLTGLGLVLVLAGGSAAIGALTIGAAVFGALLALAGAALALWALDLLPSPGGD